ncbi:MAG TPA: helix-turn-helix transcriptional regulator [Burkholderiaceae bacterium]
MPAKPPDPGDVATARLQALGAQIRAQRQHHKLSATTVAEAAGMSRVTLHRIERGEPSVTMGAYMSAISAIGLELELVDPVARKSSERNATIRVPAHIVLDEFPQLKRLAWQLKGTTEITPAEALSLYERNWRHLDHEQMLPHERALVDALIATVGKGRPLV